MECRLNNQLRGIWVAGTLSICYFLHVDVNPSLGRRKLGALGTPWDPLGPVGHMKVLYIPAICGLTSWEAETPGKDPAWHQKVDDLAPRSHHGFH